MIKKIFVTAAVAALAVSFASAPSFAKGKKKAATKTAEMKTAPKKQAGLITLSLPEAVVLGKPVTVKINHSLPVDLGEQVLTVTIKGGPNGQRLDRKTAKATGQGVAEVTFNVPANVPGGVVSFAAFVGEDYQTSLQHLQSAAIPAK